MASEPDSLAAGVTGAGVVVAAGFFLAGLGLLLCSALPATNGLLLGLFQLGSVGKIHLVIKPIKLHPTLTKMVYQTLGY